MCVVPEVIIVPGSRRESLLTVSDELPKLMRVVIQVVARRLDLASRYATQTIDHDLIRLVIAEPANVAFQGVDATVRHPDSHGRKLANRTTSPRWVELTPCHWSPRSKRSLWSESATPYRGSFAHRLGTITSSHYHRSVNRRVAKMIGEIFLRSEPLCDF
jgi:hypothetical protein